MAILREQPYRNSNFLVDFGRGDSRSVLAGFAEVIFPDFIVDRPDAPQRSHGVPHPVERGDASAANRLVLKRGVIGSLDLYAWWDEARNGAVPPKRTVKIELLGEDQETVVLTWRFDNVRPVSLSYSPLHAMDGSILMETLTLEFDRMEMA